MRYDLDFLQGTPLGPVSLKFLFRRMMFIWAAIKQTCAPRLSRPFLGHWLRLVVTFWGGDKDTGWYIQGRVLVENGTASTN